MNESMYVPYCECTLLMARADVPHEVVQKNVAMTKPVHILYYNARSLLPKFAVAEATCPDVICIVESWLSDEISDNELATDNYQILRLNRNRHGGGVVMYIHSSLSHQVLSAGANNLELLIVSVSTLYGKFCISLFYHPPSSNVEIFDSLCTALLSLNPPFTIVLY